jgi:hypothetical protein
MLSAELSHQRDEIGPHGASEMSRSLHLDDDRHMVTLPHLTEAEQSRVQRGLPGVPELSFASASERERASEL